MENGGTAEAASFTVRFYLSKDATITSADTPLGDVNVTSLAAGVSQAISRTVAIPGNLSTGTYYIGVVADALGQVAESSESNNARVRSTKLQ